MILAYLALIARILMLGYERIVVRKLGEKSDSLGATFLFFGLATMFLAPVLVFYSPPEDWGFIQWVIPAAFIYSFAFILYVKSLSEGETSLVAPLYNFNVFFLLILAGIFLDEKASIFRILGIVLLFYGSSFLNRQKKPHLSIIILFRERAPRFMIACSLLMAFGRTIDGYMVRSVSPLYYAFFLYLGISVFLLVYVILWKKWKNTIRLLKEKPVPSLMAGSINAYSYLFLIFAFTKIDVSVAEPASMLGMIVTVVLAHYIYGEKIRDRLVAVAIMILGAWLLTM